MENVTHIKNPTESQDDIQTREIYYHYLYYLEPMCDPIS